MYIQPNAGESPVQLPKDYRGHAFDSAPEAPMQEEMPQAAPTPPPPPEAQEAAPVFGRQEGDGREREPHAMPPLLGGLLSRFPVLSTLVPPSRERGCEKREGGEWLTWVLIGLAVLLFLDERSDDILPLLLLLLLWD